MLDAMHDDFLKVLFYGSSKVINGYNSRSEESINKRNELIGLNESEQNEELLKFANNCFNDKNTEGSDGQSATLIAQRIAVVPFRYHYAERFVIQNLEKVILDNENFVHAKGIVFPLMSLKTATSEGLSFFSTDPVWTYTSKIERAFKSEWCCFGHYYLALLKKALVRLNYTSSEFDLNSNSGNLINEKFTNKDGQSVFIHADAGL